MTTLAIKTTEGIIEIEPDYLSASEKLAIHPQSTSFGFNFQFKTITHVPTGFLILNDHALHMEKLVALVKRLDMLDWDFTGLLMPETTFNETVAILRGFGYTTFDGTPREAAESVAPIHRAAGYAVDLP